MAAFLVASLTNSGLNFTPVVAADLATLEGLLQTAVTRYLATGLPLYEGFKDLSSLAVQNMGGNTGRLDGELLLGVIALDASGKLTLGGTNITWT
jgi:hypothetical protein